MFSSLSFKLESGKALHIKGENGAGKSSLLKLLSGMARADEGEVLWQGKNIFANDQAFYDNLLFIGHKSGINQHLNAQENLAWYSKLHGVNASAEQLDEIYKQLGLYGFEDIPAGKLSAGQQRRIALCRLMLSEKLLWILDEPLVSLDQSGIKLFQSLLLKQLQKGGAVIFTSHQDFQLESDAVERIQLDTFKAQIADPETEVLS